MLPLRKGKNILYPHFKHVSVLTSISHKNFVLNYVCFSLIVLIKLLNSLSNIFTYFHKHLWIVCVSVYGRCSRFGFPASMGSTRECWVNNASIGVQPARDQFQTNTELVNWITQRSYISFRHKFTHQHQSPHWVWNLWHTMLPPKMLSRDFK